MASKKKTEWFGMKPNEFITYAVAGTIVLLLILDYLGIFNRFKTADSYSFTESVGDTDPAILESIGNGALKNIEDSLVDNIPTANIPKDEASMGNMLMQMASEIHIMAMEEMGTNIIEKNMKNAMISLTKMPMEDAMQLMDQQLVDAIMQDFSSDFAKLPIAEAKEKAAKKAAEFLADPQSIASMSDSMATKAYLQKEVAKMGGDVTDTKALAKVAKKAGSILKASGSFAFPQVTDLVWSLSVATTKLSYQVPMTIGSMVMRKLAGGAAVNIAARKAQAMAMKQAIKMQLKLIQKTIMKKGMASAAKFLMGAAIGPIGWALEIIGIIGTIFDMWDFNNESERLDMSDYNAQVDYVESRASVMAQINAQAWPPIASAQRFFPEEYHQATQDVYMFFQERAVDNILEFPDNDISLFAFVQKMMYNLPKRVYEEEVLKKVEGIDDTTIDQQEARFGAFVMKMMEKASQMRDVAIYNSLIRHITENCNRDFENAKNAPFWYFAMSIPTAYYTGTSDVTDIPAGKRGINYSNLTINDIKISEEREEFGKKYIDIYRAKIPYREERVRAYEIKESDIKDDLGDALIPEMPDIDAIAENGTAEYTRYLKKGFMDNMIIQLATKNFGAPTKSVEKNFGFRDQGKCYGCRAPNNAHSNWLAMCCFQQFLIQLATHSGVNVDLGPEGIMYNEDRVSLLYGVFKWKDKYYRAFQPKPWHEPRFVSIDLGYVDSTEGSIYLNEAAASRWNEVYEHLRTAGSVIYQYRGISADRIPSMPVAIWSKYYPIANVDQGENGPTPLATRVIKNFNDVTDVYKKNGRIHFRRPVASRLVKMMSLSDFSKINGNFVDKVKGWGDIFEKTDIDPVPVEYSSVSDELEANKFYSLKLDSGLDVVFYNGNTTGVNPWLKKTLPIIKNKRDVTAYPNFSKVKDYINSSFVHHIKDMPGGTFLNRDDEGVFDAEIMVDGYEELVWVNEIGKPNPKFYSSPSGIPHETPEVSIENNQELNVRIYSITVRIDDESSDDYQKKKKVYFVNHDGTVNPNWSPRAPSQAQIGARRMMMFPIPRIYQWCTKGMENDDSMALHAKLGDGWDAMYDDNDYANKKGIYEQYRVQTMSGVPHASMDNGAITFNDYYEEERYGDNYVVHGWQTFDHDTRRCYIKNKKSAERYCQKYKGEVFKETSSRRDLRDGGMMYQGECKLQAWTFMFTFLVGENIIRMINRGKT